MRKLYLIIFLIFTGLCTSAVPVQDNQLTKQEKKTIKTIQNKIKQLKKDLKNLNKDTSIPSHEKNWLRKEYENRLLLLEERLGTTSPKEIESSDLTRNVKQSANNSYSDSRTSTHSTSSDGIKETNSKYEIVLTVTSDGATKEEAVKNALRSAIEQSYGAFVSANTIILNDELVRDEIITVTNGAIKEYSELSSILLSNGRYNVTITATVSLPHLITYAKNHGSECEFAGSNFGRDLKLFKIEQENELKILNNMLPVVKDICKNTMHWEMEIGEPFIPSIGVDYYEYVDGTSGIRGFYGNNPPFNTSSDVWSFKWETYTKLCEYFKSIVYYPSDYCCFKVKIHWIPNGDKIEFIDYIVNTLKAISLSKETSRTNDSKGFGGSSLGDFLLRCDRKSLDTWLRNLEKTILSVKNNFRIKNGYGEKNEFYPFKILSMERGTFKGEDSDILYYRSLNNGTYFNDYRTFLIFGGDGLFGPICIGSYNLMIFDMYYNILDTEYLEIELAELTDCKFSRRGDKIEPEKKGEASWTIFVIAPIWEVSKYTSFKIEPNYN